MNGEQESTIIIPDAGTYEQPKRKTAGEHYLELMQKNPEEIDVVEMQQEMQKDWMKNIIECVDTNKKKFPGDFYVVIETKREVILSNVIRNYFIGRQSCPTPNYDNTVWKYHRDEDRLEFLWVIPSRETCYTYLGQKDKVDPSEYELLKLIQDFADGTLLKKCKELNGEYQS